MIFFYHIFICISSAVYLHFLVIYYILLAVCLYFLRHIWDLISQFKSGRTIIFTTHHLDEAELLSDKLAIIHQGSLLASGTVSELKKQFGNSGFELTINLKENQSPDEMEIHVKNSVSNAVKLPKRHRKGKTKIIF